MSPVSNTVVSLVGVSVGMDIFPPHSLPSIFYPGQVYENGSIVRLCVTIMQWQFELYLHMLVVVGHKD